ncbi:MAG TPA: MBL fold metallo-hydrolase, partial [Bacteriovoracaceae bacterium]|nr:MBL fold metallo-hydrolase [Bacteriovoracaceae bacterium]
MKIQHFFDPDTFTLTYLVMDTKTKDAVIIDPVLDFDPASGEVSDSSATELINYVKTEGLNVRAILETHAHADHLSSSQLLKNYFPDAKIGIGEKIKLVQEFFKNHFNLDFVETNGSQFDYLFKDFEEVQFGSLKM